jgi:N-acetylglutamate synthase-like GNAT family acetyltransferase
MIRQCTDADFPAIHRIINEAAQAYNGVIPADCWKEPYMSEGELRHEIAAGVAFWGCEEAGCLVGVMGIQDVKDVTLIRHAYVRPAWQRKGVGGKLLSHLLARSTRPVLIGTWAAATWAVRFYERHGFRLVSPGEKDRLLRQYWSVPPRQIANSVVLVEAQSRAPR